MQDGDLLFPENIALAYYAIYNLFCKYALGEDIDDWLIANQAIASESDETLWSSVFRNALVSAGAAVSRVKGSSCSSASEGGQYGH